MKVIITIIFVFFMVPSSSAQETVEADSVTLKVNLFELSFDVKDPLFSFDQAVDKTLFGFGLAYYRQLNVSGYRFWGISTDYSFMGSVSETYSDVVDGQLVDIEETTTSHFFNVYAHYRHFPDIYLKRIEPFVEVGLGLRMFANTTSSTILGDDESADIDFNRFNASVSFGGGIGAEIFIASNFFVHCKISYYTGTSAKYLVKDDQNFSPTIDNFRLEKTQTDLINYHIGATFAF